jgi:starvation-inducible outer membrane lipoprotein
MTRFPAPALLALLLSACATLPDAVAKAPGPVAPPTALLPVEDILAQGDALKDGTAVIGPIETRAAALRARAARLRSQ